MYAGQSRIEAISHCLINADYRKTLCTDCIAGIDESRQRCVGENVDIEILGHFLSYVGKV